MNTQEFNRVSWDAHWIQMAYLVSSRFTCKARTGKYGVGAVFVRNKRHLADGFNGVPSGYPHPTECNRKIQGFKSGERLDLCLCNHAEQNAISSAARMGISIEGATAYVTDKPCQSCMGLMANAGIVRVVYDKDYPSINTEDIAKYSNIKLEQFNNDTRY